MNKPRIHTYIRDIVWANMIMNRKKHVFGAFLNDAFIIQLLYNSAENA